jgi:hypothetical protein
MPQVYRYVHWVDLVEKPVVLVQLVPDQLLVTHQILISKIVHYELKQVLGEAGVIGLFLVGFTESEVSLVDSKAHLNVVLQLLQLEHTSHAFIMPICNAVLVL